VKATENFMKKFAKNVITWRLLKTYLNGYKQLLEALFKTALAAFCIIQGTVSPAIRLYFKVYKIKSILSVGPLMVLRFFI
jgi:hypothetical protein